MRAHLAAGVCDREIDPAAGTVASAGLLSLRGPADLVSIRLDVTASPRDVVQLHGHCVLDRHDLGIVLPGRRAASSRLELSRHTDVSPQV